MKPRARYIVIEMARRMAKINGSANSKKGDLAKAAGFDQIRLSEAAIVHNRRSFSYRRAKHIGRSPRASRRAFGTR
jgi:hypothetical protein